MERIAIKKKKEDVKNLEKKLKKAVSFYVVDFTGLNANEMNKLRKTFLKEDYDYFVTHNNILKRAGDNLDFKEIDTVLTGPNALSISYDDPLGPAKIIKDYYKETKLLSIKLCYIEGEWFSPEDAYKIADLPSREVLIGQFLNVLFSPISRFSIVLRNILSNCVSVFDEIRKVKERESAAEKEKKQEAKEEKIPEKEIKKEEKPKKQVKKEEKPEEEVKEEEKEKDEVEEEEKKAEEVKEEEKPEKEVKEEEKPQEEINEEEKQKDEVKKEEKGKSDKEKEKKTKEGKKEGKNTEKKVEEKSPEDKEGNR